MLIQNTNNAVPQASLYAGSAAPVSPDSQTTSVSAAAVAAAAAAAPAVTATPAPSTAQLQNAVLSTNQAMLAKGLAFSVDATTKQTVVKLMDTQTGTVIGQFPSQQMIDISKAIELIQEQLQQASLSRASVQTAPGLLIKQQA